MDAFANMKKFVEPASVALVGISNKVEGFVEHYGKSYVIGFCGEGLVHF